MPLNIKITDYQQNDHDNLCLLLTWSCNLASSPNFLPQFFTGQINFYYGMLFSRLFIKALDYWIEEISCAYVFSYLLIMILSQWEPRFIRQFYTFPKVYGSIF